MEPLQRVQGAEFDADNGEAAAAVELGNKTGFTGDSEDINGSFSSLMSSNMDRLVRFEDYCVVIPEFQKPSRVPKLTTKSLSVSLWKRGRFGIASQSDIDVDVDDGPGTNEGESGHVKVKLTVPTIRRSSSLKSPLRNIELPITPCLIHRDPSVIDLSSPSRSTTTPRPARAASLSPVRGHRLDEAQPITIPLRPCCAACLRNVEFKQLAKSGESTSADDWNSGVKFTRGALRLYRTALVEKKIVGRWQGGAERSSSGDGSGFTGAASIKVDEVDKKLGGKSDIDTSVECIASPSSASSGDSKGSKETYSYFDFEDQPGRNKGRTSHHKVSRCVAPPSLILETDEEDNSSDQLFPLPSPRRTPTSSPFASPNVSTSCVDLTGTSPISPVLEMAVPVGTQMKLSLKNRQASASMSALPTPPITPGSVVVISRMPQASSSIDLSTNNYLHPDLDVEVSDTASSTIAMEDAYVPLQQDPLPAPLSSPITKRRHSSLATASNFFRASAEMIRSMSLGASTVVGAGLSV